jgi:hypothetical protein
VLFCRTLMILVSHYDDTFMTGPSPVDSPKTKRDREKEPYSGDESDKLNNNGDKGRRFYIDVVGDRVLVGDSFPSPVCGPLFPQVVTPQQYQAKADHIQNPVIKSKFDQTVNRKVKFDEDRFIRSPEGQRSLSDQGSRVFLRDGLLVKQTTSRKETEVGNIVSDLTKVTRETLDATSLTTGAFVSLSRRGTTSCLSTERRHHSVSSYTVRRWILRRLNTSLTSVSSRIRRLVPLSVRTTVGARKFTRPLDLCSPPSLVPTSDRRKTTTR